MSPSSASADVCNAQMPNMIMWTSFFSISYPVNATAYFYHKQAAAAPCTPQTVSLGYMELHYLHDPQD